MAKPPSAKPPAAKPSSAKAPSDTPRRRLRATPSLDTPLRGPDKRPSRQAPLFRDPMPERVEPCLATLSQKAPAGSHWAFEVKWDGYRLHVHVEPSGVRIVTRGGHDWTHRFPAIAEAARKLGVATAIFDGEAVVLDAEGRSDFALLQRALGGRGGKRVAHEVMFYAFDCLYLDGRDLRSEPFDERREALAATIEGDDGWIRLSEEIEGDGATFLAAACEIGLEGIIAKDRRKPYRSGRGTDWLKVKCVRSESFAIIGYESSEDALGKLGRLLLAARDGDALVHVGSVGTGFTAASATALRKVLEELRCDRPAVPLKGKGIVWTEPTLVAEVAFRGWTGDGMLRHASYKGYREEADRAAISSGKR